jgi:hypothetical protein
VLHNVIEQFATRSVLHDQKQLPRGFDDLV